MDSKQDIFANPCKPFPRACHTLAGLQVTNQSSEIADDRPSAACEFAPGGGTLATGAWSGLVKLWSVPNCQKKLTIKAHEDRVTGQYQPASVQTMCKSYCVSSPCVSLLITGCACVKDRVTNEH